ncbi:MAG: hypothetical protein R3C56_39185 [Pirellulaceae bacterium]
MNTCPVYRRGGGHSYSNTVPGPIGSVLSAPSQDAHAHHSPPYARTLCGSCTDVCPVKIPLHHQLLACYGELAERKLIPFSKRLSMKSARVAGNAGIYCSGGLGVRGTGLRFLPHWLTHNRLNTQRGSVNYRWHPSRACEQFRRSHSMRPDAPPSESSEQIPLEQFRNLGDRNRCHSTVFTKLEFWGLVLLLSPTFAGAADPSDIATTAADSASLFVGPPTIYAIPLSGARW